MVCKFIKLNKWMGWCIFALGVVSLLYGLLTFLIVQPEGKAANTLLGMFAGFGFAVILLGIRRVFHRKHTPKEQLEQEEIDRNDERNIAISRAACAIGMLTGVITMAVLAFILMGMGMILPSYLCIGAMYLMLLAAKIAKMILEKKM